MRQIAYCGDHTALAFTTWGDKIYVDTRDTSLAPHILLEGDWETWVSKCFIQLLSEMQGATVIDVGANFGWYTLLAAHFGAARVYAFEPNLRPCNLLHDSVKVNGYGSKVTVLPMACGAKKDMARLAYTLNELGGARLLKSSPADDEEVVSVPVTALDEALLNTGLLDMAQMIIKIDVEGFEPDVISGAKKIIETHHPVLFIEHHRTNEARAMLESLTALGYRIYRAEHSGRPSGILTVDKAMETGDAETLICEAIT